MSVISVHSIHQKKKEEEDYYYESKAAHAYILLTASLALFIDLYLYSSGNDMNEARWLGLRSHSVT